VHDGFNQGACMHSQSFMLIRARALVIKVHVMQKDRGSGTFPPRYFQMQLVIIKNIARQPFEYCIDVVNSIFESYSL